MRAALAAAGALGAGGLLTHSAYKTRDLAKKRLGKDYGQKVKGWGGLAVRNPLLAGGVAGQWSALNQLKRGNK